MGLTTTSEKDAYKQFGTVWMLGCTGKHHSAGVVLGVVIAPWSSNECSKPSCSQKIKVQSFDSVESFQDPKIASGNPS